MYYVTFHQQLHCWQGQCNCPDIQPHRNKADYLSVCIRVLRTPHHRSDPFDTPSSETYGV